MTGNLKLKDNGRRATGGELKQLLPIARRPPRFSLGLY
jgi:hypothetical protein